VKAIFVPSGDQLGEDSQQENMSELRSGTCSLPSAFMM
jgi:hypothetical protein